MWPRARAVVRAHRALFVVLLAASLLRLAALVAYPPVLLWSDSWAYFLSSSVGFPGILVDKPVGYPIVLRVLDAAPFGLHPVAFVQHLAGLAGGLLLYVVLLRQGVRRTSAALTAGVVLLDSYAVALEQHVLSEAIFTLLLMCWLFAALRRDTIAQSMALAGAVLALTVTVRPVALFVIPVWIVYVFWAFPSRRIRLVAVIATLAPLGAYAGFHAAAGRGVALTETDGFSLYSRVAEIGDCVDVRVDPELRSLCPPVGSDDPEVVDPVDFYQWAPASPVYRSLGDPYRMSVDERAQADAKLKAFGTAVIRQRPGAFASLIARETTRFFTPGAMSLIPSYDAPIRFPARAVRPDPYFEDARRSLQPDYVSHARWPAATLVSYQRWIHTPRWLLGPLVAASLICLLLGFLPGTRRWVAHQKEVFLLTGSGCALLVGGVLNHFEVRYAIPAVPLLLGGGGLALDDLWVALRGLRSRRGPAGLPERAATS